MFLPEIERHLIFGGKKKKTTNLGGKKKTLSSRWESWEEMGKKSKKNLHCSTKNWNFSMFKRNKIVFQSPSVFQVLAVKLWWFPCENLSLATPRPSALSSKLLKCINLSFVCFVHLNHVQQRLLLLDSLQAESNARFCRSSTKEKARRLV